MARAEFDKPTKRAALHRSGGLCEANGSWYGLEDGQRCNAPLAQGVEFDHVDLDANSKDSSLQNCAAVCKPCHRWKTENRDIPLAAKTKRQADKDAGIVGRKQKIRSAPFPKASKQPKLVKRRLPHRPFYRSVE